ncbi:MAG TPA: CBS domain-containing protein [Nitrososphaeraceae archaeon]|jgi:CBS domain-containing protein
MPEEKISVGQLVNNTLETINIADSAQKASKKMRDKNISSLVVIDDNNKAAGIVTERDLVRKVCVNDASSSNIQIKDIMSFPLLTIDANSTVEQAVDIMIQNGVRHILVTENNDVYKPLGIITPSDFTKYLKATLDIDDDLNTKILESMQEDR